MSSFLNAILGPRVPNHELESHRARYLTPTLILSAARILLLVSLFLPYWHMTLEAPQYPDGLSVTAYVNHLTGDVREINALNHYIGMRPLEEAAQFERAASVWMIIAMVLLVEGAALVHNRWAALLALPVVFFPVGFLVDLSYWLKLFGTHLDPKAPLSSSVKPFIPPVLGKGTVGQFVTVSSAGTGWYLAVAGSLLVILALYFHRRAYKPLHKPFPIAPAASPV
ncbi:MAG: cytochrome C [Planctomycetota bacterium]